MRRIFLLVMLAMMPVLAMPEAASAATQKPTEQQQEQIKKKKAAEAKKAREKKAADARKARDKKAAEAKKAREKKAAEAKRAQDRKDRARKLEASSASAQRSCGRFLDCVFGKPRRGVQVVSTRKSVPDQPTAENISWAAASNYAPGSIVVKTPERALYLVTGPGEARRYKVGVGKEGFQWSGTSSIVNKAEWPTWRPPQAMIEREAAKGHYLPDEMEGG
ncbi:MAG: L,D-transpeptidase, partial [Aestuariivirga sp.]|nr:L,D-transpeptidase [Aestuariivirga sp.]